MKKIVLAIDSFKGCLSSKEIEQCIAEEIHRILPSCQTVCIPIADGGEGMLRRRYARHTHRGNSRDIRIHPSPRPLNADMPGTVWHIGRPTDRNHRNG